MAGQPGGLECREEESRAQRGAAEPFLRLHNLYPSARCARQSSLARPSRRAASQHSYPLNRFSSAPWDPMERPTSQADLELDYNPPRVQLSDEMFVFQDGRWVSESCRLPSPHCSPPASFYHKLHHKRLAKDHLLQEENRALRDENRALRDENRALRRENTILQVVWEEHREGGRAAKEPAGPEDAAPHGREGSALHLLQENRAMQQLLEHRKAHWAQPDDKLAPAAAAEASKPAPSPHAEPHGSGLLTDQGTGLPAPYEELKGPVDEEDGGEAGPGLPDGRQALKLLRDMNRALQALRDQNQSLQALRDENRLLQEENRALHALRVEHRLFQDENKALWENNKLRLQQKLVIDTVTEVTARMEMLIEELYAFMPAKSKDPKKPSRV